MKTKSTFITLILLTGCVISNLAQAQSLTPPKRAEIWLTVQPGDTTMPRSQSALGFRPGSGPAVKSNTQQQATLFITLNDGTSDVDSIHVIVSTLNDSILFLKTFANSEGIFSDGTYLSKPGTNAMQLGLGKMVGVNSFKSEVYFESSSGNTSPVVQYMKQ